MPLRQYDFVKRAAFSGNPSHYYYWTSTYYYDTADFGSPLAALSRAFTVDRFITTQYAAYPSVVTKEPPGRGNVVLVSDLFFQTGLLTAPSAQYSLLNIGRVFLTYAGDTPSYKLARMPLPSAWETGGLLTSTAVNALGGWVNSMRAISGFPPARNKRGAVLVGGRVYGDVHMWQMRHGTKRREKTF